LWRKAVTWCVEAKNLLEKFPLGQAGLMGFDYIPLGPLRIINDLVK